MSGPRRLAVVVSLLLLPACGLRTDKEATTVDDAKVPFGLLASTTTTSMPDESAADGGPVTICFREGPAVVPLVRSAPDQGVTAALRLFLQGPTAEEASRGLSSAVFAPSAVSGASVAAGVATVELSPTFADAGAGTQLDVIVELVCTLTAQPGVGQVAFELSGQRIDVPRGDGSLTAQPVSRDDYPGAIRDSV